MTAKGTGHPSYAGLSDQFRKNTPQNSWQKYRVSLFVIFLATSFLEIKVALEIK